MTSWKYAEHTEYFAQAAKRLRLLRAKVGELIGLPRSVAQLKEIQPFEFQNWVFEKLHGRVNPRKTGDFGIDGWVELDVPCQVKQSSDVGRNVVDNFETAIQRYGKDRGVDCGIQLRSRGL